MSTKKNKLHAKLCLSNEQISNIDKILQEIEKKDDDPEFSFLASLNGKETKSLINSLIKKFI